MKRGGGHTVCADATSDVERTLRIHEQVNGVRAGSPDEGAARVELVGE